MTFQRRETQHAPGFQVQGLWQVLARLDRILEHATAARASSSSDGPYCGPYIVTDGRVVRRTPEQATSTTRGGLVHLAEARLDWLRQAFDLTPFDLDVLVLALAPQIDLRYVAQFAYLQDGGTQHALTIDVALNLLCASADAKIAARQHFEPDAPLMRQRLLSHQPDDNLQPPLLTRPLQLDDVVVRFCLGQGGLDQRLQACARRVSAASDMSGQPSAKLAETIGAMLESGKGAHCYLQVPAISEAELVVTGVAAALRMELLHVDTARVTEGAASFQDTMALLFRDVHLLGTVLHLTGSELLTQSQQNVLAEALAAPGTPRIVLMSGTRPCASRFSTMTPVVIPAPDFRERRAAWNSALRRGNIELEPTAIDELAARYSSGVAQIASAVAAVAHEAALRRQAPGMADLARAARRQGGRDPGPLGRKLEPGHTWQDLVLPEHETMLLREFCNRVRHRHVVFNDWGFGDKLSLGHGVSALFSGPPGTGKTMAVEVIAADLGLDLFKIDLSQVVSKYVGETEKALDRLFNEASAGNAILFFDECDALFGKRTTVQDAHDRYANIEVAYLLQKLEEHDGITIMATNLRANVDVAFTRRFSFIVEFPFPDVASRRRLWQTIWPEQVPKSTELDLEFMATQFRLSGGAVRNIALAAAFLAARDGSELRTEHLLLATRTEMEKSGQRTAITEFGPYGRRVEALTMMGAAT